jgi:Rhamnan synthesis protein F
VNDLAAPTTPARETSLEPERIFPTAPKPLIEKKRVKLLRKLRQLPARYRQRSAEQREEGLGTAGRILARWAGNAAGRAGGERVAIYSHYASSGRVSAMVLFQLATYASQGFDIIFVSMCQSLREADIDKLKERCSAIVLRRSYGRDFGAWRDILSTDLVNRSRIQELLLLNDSVLGPIRPIAPVFERMRRADGLWGLVNSDQNGSHLQTFFLLARGAPAIEAVLGFFHCLVLSLDKEVVVQNGELSLSPGVARRGVPLWSLYGLRQIEEAMLKHPKTRLETVLSFGRPALIKTFRGILDCSDEDFEVRVRCALAANPVNPTHQFGELLVREFDFPFIKTELLLVNPTNMSIASTWRSLVADDGPCSVDMIIDHLCLV